MAKYLTVSIPEPCREDWNKMSPDPTGRHCSSCEKSVVDFTLMSDSQVAEFFRKHNDKVCGRFYEDQLEREIAFPKKQMALLKYFFTVSIPAFLFSLKAGAQIKPIPPATEIMPTRGTLYGETVSNYRIVNGFVKDTAGLPVEGASIRIAGTNRGVSADTNGAFQLILSKADSILIISSVQAETKNSVFL